MVKETAFYDRLEVSPTSSIDEIKKKGKKLLIKWHPDKNPNNVEASTKKFQDIQEALSVLENPEKKEIYDKFGIEGIKGDMGQGGNPFGGGDPFAAFSSVFGGGSPFGGGNPFGGGGGFNPFGGNQQREERENIVEKLNVTLEQIYKEESVNLKYNQKVVCIKCNGEGSANGLKQTCNDCNGKGMKVRSVRMGPIVQNAIAPCGSCNAKGKIIPDANKCTGCNAGGFVMKEKVIAIPLKNGFGNGLKMQLEGKGNQVNGQKTDLIVIINELEHPVFKRKGNDLIVEVELKLFQALFGFDKVITHLDGRKLHLHHTGKTNYGTIRKVSEEGMADLRTKRNGDLIINFKIDLPTITNETLTKALTLINKEESIIEKNIQTEENLVKTIMVDTYKKEYEDNQEQQEEQQEQRGQECVQQ